MKVWLDTHRQPDVDWVWLKTPGGAITVLRGGCVEKISFAPDQPELVEPVVDWMLDHDSPARCAVHPSGFRAKKPRPLLCSRPAKTAAYTLDPDPKANL